MFDLVKGSGEAMRVDVAANEVPDVYEVCIMCKQITPVLRSTPIEQRIGYERGLGQLCMTCFHKHAGAQAC